MPPGHKEGPLDKLRCVIQPQQARCVLDVVVLEKSCKLVELVIVRQVHRLEVEILCNLGRLLRHFVNFDFFDGPIMLFITQSRLLPGLGCEALVPKGSGLDQACCLLELKASLARFLGFFHLGGEQQHRLGWV